MSEQYEIYKGAGLGASYTEEGTFFRLWAPTAEAVALCLYEEGDGDCLIRQIPMSQGEKGTWYYEMEGDCDGTYYTYRVTIDGKVRESGDPYARAVGVNGIRSMVVDLADTDPEGFREEGISRASDPDPAHAVVTEISVRDITADESSGVSLPHRGKFLGLTETGTKNAEGLSTGIDYLKELGVTHVQIMPFYDFGSIDESKPLEGQYNWGYDPVNYNVPEGSYSTDPFHGKVRIRECKEMIMALHRAGIGVIMDVVYNHTFNISDCVFQKCVPDYFYRRTESGYSNASACGNEIASERPMVRRYIVDSVKYWVEEYHIDGFRFDLMGVLDIETMQAVHDELKRMKPDILIYGEGWAGGDSVLPPEKRALKCNTKRMQGIGMFSDDMRDTVKGHVFYEKETGFVNGSPEKGLDLRFSIVGAVRHPQVDYSSYTYSEDSWASAPTDVVNYVSCHDNLTLWDKLLCSVPNAKEQELLAMNRLAAAIIFTSQGMPFFLCGEDFARTKPDGKGGCCENSYNLPVEVNRLDYGRLTRYRELNSYYRGLIAFRKAHPSLWLQTAGEVAAQLHFEKTTAGVAAFTVRTVQEIAFVVYNATATAKRLPMPHIQARRAKTSWQVYIEGERAGNDPIRRIGTAKKPIRRKTSSVVVGSCSCLVCCAKL